jgi:hypothetical protein
MKIYPVSKYVNAPPEGQARDYSDRFGLVKRRLQVQTSRAFGGWRRRRRGVKYPAIIPASRLFVLSGELDPFKQQNVCINRNILFIKSHDK